MSDVASQLGTVPSRLRAIVERADDAALRRRPHPTSWSAVEYLGHIRDLMAFHRWLIERASAEDTPRITPADPDAAVAAAGYNDADLSALLDQLERRVSRLRDLITTLDPTTERRQLVVGPDQERIDIGFVARSALHEWHHHALDLARLLTPRTTSE